MIRLTPVVRNIIIINVIIFVLQNVMPGVTNLLSLWNVRSDNFMPYQLFTYMFCHGGFFHIFFNMIVLASMGPVLESFWGQNRFIIFYLFTGIGAGVFNVAIDFFFLDSPSFGLMMGASGAIYGVLMGFGMLFPNMEVMLLIPPIPIKAKYLVWVLGLMTLLIGGGNVAHLAHLGGIIFAFILIRYWRSQGGSYF
ncbi:MAG: rhomboid family intramembrane serine protease [Cyclobacteriaceae bacterium]|nr:rhomboid family intramembrane serine protease [Cyclobacteriaceae bacterium]